MLGRDAGADMLVAFLQREGWDAVVKRLFGAIWVIFAMSGRVVSISGTRAGPPSPGCTAVQTQPCHGDTRLQSPRVKRKRIHEAWPQARLSFPFSPQTWEGGAAPPGPPGSGGSWSAGSPRRPRSAPSRPPQRSAPAGSCF